MQGLPLPPPKKKKKATYLFRRIYLLLWKNVLFRKRHYVVTTFEVILPTLLALLMAFLRTQLDEGSYKVVDRISNFPATTEQELFDYTGINILCEDCVLAFTPVNPLTEEIIKRFKNKFSQTEFSIKGFETERELEIFAEEADLKSALDDPKLKAAIVFDGLGTDEEFFQKALNGSFPTGYKFKYRFRPAAYNVYTENLFEWLQFPGPELENAAKYTLGGYTGTQILMDRVIIELMTGKDSTEEIQTQVFPYPPYIEVKDFSQFYFILLPLLLVLGFIFIVPSTIRNVVSERESGIKELMKLMGLPNWMHWLGWMINSLLVLSFSITIVIFLLFYTFNEKTGPVIGYSSPMVWWIVLFLFVTAVTAFCFFISTWSERPTLATTLGIILYLVTYFGLFIPLEARYRTLTLNEKLSAALIPTIALHWAIKVMCGFEGKAAGSSFSNFWDPVSDVDGLSVGNICTMLVLDIILYTVLTLYFEAILPSKYGIRRPWYFLFKPSTWVTPTQKVTIRRQSIYSLHESNKPGFESEPENLNPGVVIHKLTKKFGKKKVAVNEISIKMYEGQITALLGHNGAGKTTTMSMLTGLFPPTSGNAYLSGFDIKHQLEEARESLGLCPQHNMLFDQLTVQEHLVFFGRIKGLGANEARKETRMLLKKLQLNEKKHAMSRDLSGGQKRKLSLGMALIGGTKVVILDEPTSGMDPEARRVIWDLLLEMRGKRTIVLTTHFMEEADILGDRVAIMNNGKIECYGTPMFLKKYYGTGYTLKMTIVPNMQTKDIFQRVQKHFPKSFLKTAHAPNSAELAIAIPSEEDTTAKFPSMFLELSNDKESLGILNIGLSLTTMDEVFIKIGETDENTSDLDIHNGIDKEKGLQTTSFTTMNGDHPNNGSRTHLNDEKLRGFQLLKSQVFGLLRKKMTYTLRKWKLLLAQFIFTPLVVAAAIYLSTQTSAPSTNSPPRTMKLDDYNKPKTIFYAENTTVGKIYEGLVGDSAIPVKEDLLGRLVTLGAVDLGKFRQEYIIGAEFNESIVTALFSSIPYHAAPLSVNVVMNTILKAHSPTKDFSIEFTVHPLQNELFNVLEAAQPNASLSLFAPIIFGAFVPIGLALFAAGYIVFPIEERISKAKQLQLMTGVNTLVYWGISFLWDLFLIGAAIFVILLCFPLFQTNETYTANGGIYAIFLILVVWGFSTLSFAYFFSFTVSTPAGGFALKTVLNILFGMLLPIILFIVNNANKELDITPAFYVGRIFPTFSAAVSIMRYASLATQNSRCAILSPADKKIFCNPELEVDPQLLQCCDNCADFPFGLQCFVPEDFMEWSYKLDKDTNISIPGIPQEVLFMLIVGIIYQLIFIIIEFGAIRRIFWRLCCRTGTKRFANPVQDEDVINEKIRVKDLLQSGRSQEDGFLVTNLCKNYGNFSAVSNLNFGVHHGECFGLLGVNGAGKTTTFKMITGDEIPSNGNAYGFMRTLQNHRKEFLSNIGYCPQFDAIIGVLTGREMLRLFANLRGIAPSKREAEVEKWLKKLGLQKSGNVKSERYSGGMKRRLSVGMAMIGDSPIVLLDEPTSGVDPVARRQFWDVISSLKGSGQCVILTSHSMEECEALCTRLGIMVNGQLQCLGGVQHLKSKFAKGFSLVLRLKPNLQADDAPAYALKKDIASKLAPCELKDEHQNVLQYQILNTEMPWNRIFEIVEECKITHEDIIDDYSVSETTLEEVFLSFARKQYQSRETDLSVLRKVLTCRC